jgi:hypothetical protein
MNSNNILLAKGKHCELCGKKSDNSHYVFIVEIDYLIFTDSFLIQNHNLEDKSFIYNDTTKLHYDTQINGNIFASIKNTIIPHILCSEDCEDQLTKQKFYLTEEAQQRIGVYHCNNNEMPLSLPMILFPENVLYEENECIYCGKTFPNTNKQFSVIELEETYVRKGELNNISLIPSFSMFLTDLSDKHPDGKIFNYKFKDSPKEAEEAKKVHLCSNECAYNYALENNCILYAPNIVMQGFMTMITPNTIQINIGLNNPYKYRPSKITPIPS